MSQSSCGLPALENCVRFSQTAHRAAGLRLINLWRSVEQPDNVFFMFEVASLDKARQFIGNPEAAKAGEAAGVIDGEYFFVEDATAYAE